jgi:hypothetical protein
MTGAKPATPSPERRTRWLGITAGAAYASAALFWAAQIDPATRVNHSILITVTCWLLAWGFCAARSAALGPRYDRDADVRTIGALIEARTHARPWPPRTVYYRLAARRPVYLGCGYLAAGAGLLAAAADALLAAGVIELRGANLFLATLFVLGTASECATLRIVGPQAAAAEEACHLAAVVARVPRGARAQWAAMGSSDKN